MGQSKQAPYQGPNARDVSYSMNPREGKEPAGMMRYSPNKNEGVNNSNDRGYESSQINNMPENNNTMNMGVGNKPQQTNMPARDTYSQKEIKKLVTMSQYYDPKKTNEGRLYNEQQVSVPAADDQFFSKKY